jgi:hypothetical protein
MRVLTCEATVRFSRKTFPFYYYHHNNRCCYMRCEVLTAVKMFKLVCNISVDVISRFTALVLTSFLYKHFHVLSRRRIDFLKTAVMQGAAACSTVNSDQLKSPPVPSKWPPSAIFLKTAIAFRTSISRINFLFPYSPRTAVQQN